MFRFAVKAMLTLSVVFGVIIAAGVGVGLTLARGAWDIVISTRYLYDEPNWDKEGNEIWQQVQQFILQDIPRNVLLELSPGLEYFDSPAWSGDGQSLAFISDIGFVGENNVYVMNRIGRNLRRLTNIGLVTGRLAWSPDGQYIAFTSITPPLQSSIYTVEVFTAQVRVMTKKWDLNGSPNWSLDGKYIVYQIGQLDTDLAVVDVDTLEEQQETFTPDIAESMPIFLPDGNIAYLESGGSVVILDMKHFNTRKLYQGVPNPARYLYWSNSRERFFFTGGQRWGGFLLYLHHE